MIFVSVGTEHFPFDRLVQAVDEASQGLGGEEVFIQLGEGRYIPRTSAWSRFLSFPEMVARVSSARIVVTHAGAGSILLCARQGKVPIVMARRRSFGEHVDDHQVELAQRLAELGYVLLAQSPEELGALLKDYPRRSAVRKQPQSTCRELAQDLSAYLDAKL